MIFDTVKLKDTNTRLRYQLEVRNKFASMQETDDRLNYWSATR